MEAPDALPLPHHLFLLYSSTHAKVRFKLVGSTDDPVLPVAVTTRKTVRARGWKHTIASQPLETQARDTSLRTPPQAKVSAAFYCSSNGRKIESLSSEPIAREI